MAINSRSKGNRNERDVAALFKVWTKKDFARTPSSGGLQWKSSNSKGDIVCTSEGHYFPFCLEVKAHKEIDFAHLLVEFRKTKKRSGLCKILEFWQQCNRDAEKAKKIPILMMRYDRLPKDFFFLVIPNKFYWQLSQKVGRCSPSLIYLDEYEDQPEKELNLRIISSVDFFKLPYKKVKKLAKTFIKTQYEK